MRAQIFALCLALAGPVSAEGPEDAAGIRDTISSQIGAFRADDFATAFTYASPGIRALFGTPERFGAMVRNGYPMVWRPAEVEFLDLREIDGRLWQAVRIVDAQGDVHILGYQMEQAPDGAWKIDGVQVLRQPEVGT